MTVGNYNKRAPNLRPRPSQTVPKILEERLGSGLAVPLTIAKNQWLVNSGLTKLNQDIIVVLTTPVGCRYFQPDFGSLLYWLIFQPWNQATQSQMITATKVALQTWVPQIIVQSVTIDDSLAYKHQFRITITYLLKGTLSTSSISLTLSQDDNIQLAANNFVVGGQLVLNPRTV